MAEEQLVDGIKAAEALMSAAIAKAVQRIVDGPDNPGLNRTGPGGMTLRSSTMLGADNWSVFFHDWKAQYKWVKELLEARRFADLKKLLDGKTVEQQKLAPEVIAHVREITGELFGK